MKTTKACAACPGLLNLHHNLRDERLSSRQCGRESSFQTQRMTLEFTAKLRSLASADEVSVYHLGCFAALRHDLPFCQLRSPLFSNWLTKARGIMTCNDGLAVSGLQLSIAQRMWLPMLI